MQPRKPITDDELIVRVNKLLNVERRQIENPDYLLYAPDEKVVSGYVAQMITLCDEAKVAITNIPGDRGSVEYALVIDEFMVELQKKLSAVTFETDLIRLLHEVSESVKLMPEGQKKESAKNAIAPLKRNAQEKRSLHNLEAYLSLQLKYFGVGKRILQRERYVREEDAAQAARDARIAAPAPVKKRQSFLGGLFGSRKEQPKSSDSQQGQELVGSVRPGPRKNSDSK